MLPDDEICLILVVSHGKTTPDERVMRLATEEADRSGVQLGDWLGLRRVTPDGPTCHLFLGIRTS